MARRSTQCDKIYLWNPRKIQCATSLGQEDASFLLKASNWHPEVITRNKHFSLSNPGCSSTHEIMETSLALCISASSGIQYFSAWQIKEHVLYHSSQSARVCTGCRFKTRQARCTQVFSDLLPSDTFSLTPLSQTGIESSGSLKVCPIHHQPGPVLSPLSGWKFLGPGPV